MSVIDGATVSVAVTDCAPALPNMIDTPITAPAVKGTGPGSVAVGSLLVIAAEPPYPVATLL